MNDPKKARDALYDVQSEESLVSHFINDPKLIAEVGPNVRATLSGDRHALTRFIQSIESDGEVLGPQSLQLYNAPQKVVQLYQKLAPITPSVTPKKLAGHLRDIAARRQIATVASEAFSSSIDLTESFADICSKLERATATSRKIQSSIICTGGMAKVGETDELVEDINWRVANPGKIKGLKFGLPKLEKILDGLQPAKYYIIGARPSVGKTAMAGGILVNLAKQGIPSLMFSLEMSGLQVRQRLLATSCGVNPTKSLEGALIKSELQAILDGVREMKKWPMWIDDTDRCSIAQIESRSRLAVSRDGVKVIIIDYIQLVRGVEPKSKTSKQEEVSEVSGKLKALSKELGVPIVVLAQLKRTGNAYSGSSGSTEVPKPTLESLKESGALEQDADAVTFLHRDPSQNASEALAIVAKNRSGSNGEVELAFENDTTSFVEQASGNWTS